MARTLFTVRDREDEPMHGRWRPRILRQLRRDGRRHSEGVMGLERVTWGFCALAFGIGGNAWAAPNYIVIIADDYGSDKMRAPFAWNGTGTTIPTNFPVTTNLNALGAAALRFTDAGANPVCPSSRVSIHTGNYAWRSDIGTQLEPGA